MKVKNLKLQKRISLYFTGVVVFTVVLMMICSSIIAIIIKNHALEDLAISKGRLVTERLISEIEVANKKVSADAGSAYLIAYLMGQTSDKSLNKSRLNFTNPSSSNIQSFHILNYNGETIYANNNRAIPISKS